MHDQRLGTSAGSGWTLRGLAIAMILATGSVHAATGDLAAAPARGYPDDRLAPLSLDRLARGEALLAQGQTQAAIDAFESALAADPRNRRAYLGLARAAEADGLPGKAVRFYREALEIEPNDQAAIELQGLALMKRGATASAQDNLDRLRKLCAAPCPAADRLSAAIARGVPERSAAAADRTAAVAPPAP